MRITGVVSLSHGFPVELMQLRSSHRTATEAFCDFALCFRDVLSDDGQEWFSLPSLVVDCGLEHLLPTFTKLVEHLEVFRLAVDVVTAQEARNMAQSIAEHILACLQDQSADLPAEALREVLTIEEEEVPRTAVRDLATKVMGYFVPVPTDEGANDEERENPSTASVTSVNEASDSSSTASMP